MKSLTGSKPSPTSTSARTSEQPDQPADTFRPMESHLIQPRELFGPTERWDELRTCWDRNAGIVDAVTVPAGRATFAELFAACKTDALNIICNSDIHFDAEGIAMLGDWWAVDGRARHCMALSRWDVRPDGTSELWDHGDAHDAWIFLGRPTGISTTYLGNGRAEEIRLGVPGCDNAIAHRIKMAGYQLLNPSRTIKAFHLHNVQWRSYLADPEGRARGGDKLERVPPPYAFCKPTAL